jgi:glycerol uptake facilitator-like aquaporin
MTFPMVAGYHSKRYDDEVSFHYILVLCYILGGILAGFGTAVVKKKIAAMIQKKRSNG